MRQTEVPQGVFKPRPTGTETKQDATTRAARAIMDTEAAARERKTERLRLERLSRQATEVAPASTPKRTVRRKKA